jgi:3-oxoacyl-[acyl-carrier protein] reductase
MTWELEGARMVVQTQAETIKQQTKKLQGKVALVTGSSRGIGAAIALGLAKEGATVAINYVNSKSAADEVVAEITKLGSKASAFKANVSSEQDSKKLIDEVIKAFGKIDILVNNAGIFEMRPIDKIDIDHFQRLYDTNVKGVVVTTIAALPKISDGGRIINVSSNAAKGAFAGASIYSSTKAALESLTRIWAQELGKRHITVNAIAPGATSTDMLQQGLNKEMEKFIVEKTALGRLGETKDIADVVAFLASDDARWVTGHSLACDGGLTF